VPLCAFNFNKISIVSVYWLQNTTMTVKYYVLSNSTALPNNILVNTQLVRHNTTNVYVNTTGIPSYTTGPFLDGNP
jgi:hypothetical protein